MKSLNRKLERAFNPRAVAVVGDKRAMGYLWLNALKPFAGKVYSVQIDKDEIPGIDALGVPNYLSLLDIPDEIDYVICAVPRAVSPRIVADCIRKGVTAVNLFTSGFAETGQEEGVRLQQELGRMAREAGLLLIGPNCMGIYNPGLGLRQTEDQPAGEAGNVGFISQSGTHCINFSLLGHVHGIRCSKAVSYGNAVVLDAADYLEYLTDDPQTEVIGMYVEGPRDGCRFFAALRRAASLKPVVIWKGGLTEAGARAIYSHTAALATEQALWSAAMRQAGAISVDSLEEMVDVVKGLLYIKPGTGRRVGLIAMTGGQSVVIADAFGRANLEAPLLTPASYEKLASFFNIIGGSYRNPLDAGGTLAMGFHLDNLRRMLDILEKDANIDAVVLESAAGFLMRRARRSATLLDSLLALLSEHRERSPKPFLMILQPGHLEAEMVELRSKFLERGIATFSGFQQGANSLSKAIGYHRFRAGLE
ncbi:MAG: CoA-binding protein [Dehalococcoidia bacterium]